ncbi:hypothetical protein MTO96_031622 [Rhipicephalus appendiculatus]
MGRRRASTRQQFTLLLENEPPSDDETESLKQQIRELRRNEEKNDAEIKWLKRNVRAAEEKIARLTDALLDKIEIARSEERPGTSGSIAAVSAPHHLASDAANADNFVEATFVDMVVDTSTENVSEFILESSVDEVLGLPKEMIYAVPQEHAEEAAGVKGSSAGEGALADDGSQQATVNALAAPTCLTTEGLFAIVDGQASIHFSLTICVC